MPNRARASLSASKQNPALDAFNSRRDPRQIAQSMIATSYRRAEELDLLKRLERIMYFTSADHTAAFAKASSGLAARLSCQAESTG